jgi:ferredoxin-NADP reductase
MAMTATDRAGSISAWVLRAASALTTPLLPEDYLGLVNPLLSNRYTRGRVERVVGETEDATSLVIRPGRGWVAHRAGQWVSLGVRIDGVWHSRSYSITSAADGHPSRAFSITVKVQSGGRVSAHLVRRIGPGTVLRVAPPRGEFVLPDPVPARLVFLTGGSGITPVMAMLRTLATGSAAPDVLHVHSARHADEVIFGAELRAMARRLPWYRLHERHTGRDGRFQLAELDKLAPDWRDRPAWVCGPAGLLAQAQAHWEHAEARRRLRVERFQAPSFTTPEAQGATVRFTRAHRDVDAPAGTPLLQVGEQAGIAMPSGCRMGICFSCVAPLRSGQVRDLRTGVVHGEEGELIQTCISGAAGACAIDL